MSDNGGNVEPAEVAAAEHAVRPPVASPLAELEATFDELEFEVFTPRSGPAQHVATVPRDHIVAFVSAARELGFRMFVDLCAVDYLRRDPRYEVVVTVLSLEAAERLRIRVPIPASDPSMPSLTAIYPGSNFYEREAFDLFGIEFAGHPDLTRILLPDDWEGYPLRKDYAVGSVPVQFKGAHKAT